MSVSILVTEDDYCMHILSFPPGAYVHVLKFLPGFPETLGRVFLSQVQWTGPTGPDSDIFVSARREPGNGRKRPPRASPPSLMFFKGSLAVWQIDVILMDISVCSTNKAEPCVPNFFLPSFPLHTIFRLSFPLA